MPSLFKFDGMTGYIYDEHHASHHERHIHVYANGGTVELYFDGTVLNGNLNLLTKRQRKSLQKWIMNNQKLMVDKWKELNES